MLIGLTGDLALAEKLAYELVMHDVYERYRMDDPIRRMLREFHIQDDVWDDPDRRDNAIPWLGVSPSRMAETLREDWGLEWISDEVWLALAKGRWHHLNVSGQGRMVVPDVRYEPECKWIADGNGVLILCGEVDFEPHHRYAYNREAPIRDDDRLRQSLWDQVRQFAGVLT